jgi:CRISPR-associated protein Csm1
MKTPPWLLGTLLWDVARYLERLKLAQQFWEFYQDISVLQTADAAAPQNSTASFDALCEARSLALGENWQPSNPGLALEALKSIFASIKPRVPVGSGVSAERRYFSPQPLHDEPKRQQSRELDDETLKAHFLKFLRELQALKRWDSHQKLDTLLPLIEKYGWCLAPWGLEKENDVPLFALAKMSTAIMACWPRNGDEPPATPDRQQEIYALICGDISGIQKYIYRISSAKGVAKRLKARSFELAVLADAVAKWLLQQFKLPNANLIYSSGGKFYLLAPASAKAEIEAEGEGSINFTLAQKFWEEYNGELFLGLGAVLLSGDNFMADNFGGKWQAVTEACGKPKQKKFHLLMQKNPDQIFAPPDVGGIEETCVSCHREANKDKGIVLEKQFEGTPDERLICTICQQAEKLGRQLAKANLIAEVAGGELAAAPGVISLSPLNLGLTYYVLNEADDIEVKGGAITYWNLNIHNYADENFKMRALAADNVNCGFRFYGGNMMPKDETDEPRDFNDLADASEGIKRLGILRMDVDFLGEIFRQGLAPQNTAARVLALSWHLNYYFCGRLNTLREQTAEAEALIVYSGGDDLFIAGAWNKVLELALQIRRDFAEYTQGDFAQHLENPRLTISGGMALTPKKFPIHKSAIMSGQAEDEAKEVDGAIRRFMQAKIQPANATPPEIESCKNGFTFLDKPLRWPDFDIAVSIKDALYDAIKNADPSLNKGLLTRLRQIYTLFETRRRELKNLSRQTETELAQHVDLLMYDKWRWRLVYALKRYKDDNKEHEDLINNLQNALINNEWQPLKWENNGWQKTGKFLKSSAGVQIAGFIDMPTRWVELLTREEKES